MTRTFSGAEAHALLSRATVGSLGTLDRESGAPYVSVVNVALDGGGLPVIFISRLARHTQNLEQDARASLLVSELPREGDALTGPRVTVLGKFHPAAHAEIAELYAARHPAARMYLDFPDFSFWRLEPTVVHAVAGFGRIETMTAEEVFGRR
jgi:heme iron utilization protein